MSLAKSRAGGERKVAVLGVFRAEGDPEMLLARYDQTLDAISPAPARPEAHYCVATESGIMLVDVWSSLAELQGAIIENEDFQAKWRAAGWPEETVEVLELHNSGWPA
jgi:hypothetical protein